MSCRTRRYIVPTPAACNSLNRLSARASALAVTKSFTVGVGADHGADVPAVEHRAGIAGRRVMGEIALKGEEGGPDRGLGSDHRGGLRDLLFP